MSNVVIHVEKLSKRYRIGQRERYLALRDILARSLATPFRILSSNSPESKVSNPASNSIWALENVSFDVKEGEVVGIIGRNGAGKTTLLKILSRITRPTEGYAEIHGRVGSLLEVGTGFHPELTGRENIYLNGAILGMKKAEIELKFDEIVAFAEIEKFIDTPVKHYSSGMYVRLAFAVAAHLEPEVLLVDEVLAVGDAAFQKKCLGKMGDVARQGRTVLFVSHNMAAVEQLCSRALLLSNGRIKKSGSVDSVVGFYLLSGDELQHSRPEGALARSANGVLELISIGPVDDEGRHLSVAQCGRDFNLTILIRTSMHLPKVTVTVGINNLYDVRIAVLHSDIAGYGLSLAPGTHSIVCRVPCLSLSAGGYVMDVKVLCGNEVGLWAPRVGQFIVEAGDFYNTGRLPDGSWGGYCHLHQQWEVREPDINKTCGAEPKFESS